MEGQRYGVGRGRSGDAGSTVPARRRAPTAILRRTLGAAPPPPSRVPLVSAHPHALLRQRRVVLAPYRGYDGGPADPQHEAGLVLPASTAVPVVFTIDDSAHRPTAFAHGAHAEHSALPGPCAPLYLEVWLAPLAARRTLGVPMHHLTGDAVDLAELCGTAGRTALERVRETPDWARRHEIVDEFLLDAWTRGPDMPAEVLLAWDHLVASGGTVPVADVARAVGWSHKHLITRFNEWVGVSPKKAARVLRFEGFTRALAAGSRPSWPDLAARYGFADQAHLIRETRALTGYTPTALVSGQTD